MLIFVRMKKLAVYLVFFILTFLFAAWRFSVHQSNFQELSLLENSVQTSTFSSGERPLPSWSILVWQTLFSGEYHYNSDLFYLDFNDYQQYSWVLLTLKILSWTAQIDVQSRESWLWERFLLDSGSSLTYPLEQWLSKYQHHVGLRAIPLSWNQELSLEYEVSLVANS